MADLDMKRAIARQKFAEVTAQIMAACDSLSPAERNIRAIVSVCKSNLQTDTIDSIQKGFEYLTSAGYLHIEHEQGVSCITKAQTSFSFGNVRISVTAQGSCLLLGIEKDELVGL